MPLKPADIGDEHGKERFITSLTPAILACNNSRKYIFTTCPVTRAKVVDFTFDI